jgi:thiamine-monophosphate kinase
MDEAGRIAMLARVLGAGASSEAVVLGIGDDAAVLDVSRAPPRLVWTIDQQVEGTHFRRDLVGWHDLGWRSFMAAASDVAAMGAKPWCALSAIVLSDSVDDPAFEAIAAGQGEAASACGAPIVGGNLARGRDVSIATTLLGTCERAITRAGAVPGDGLWISGEVGLAAAGLCALEAGRGGEDVFAEAVRAWRRPLARVTEGRAMASVAHAAVDVSDGLARDASHLAAASGVQVVLDAHALATSIALETAARALAVDPCELALGGGEDYALVVASPVRPEGFRRIGDVRAGRGLVLRRAGVERPLEPTGYDHFAR